ncbi:MAG: 2-hydroxy-3-oxopropionate reductase [Hoeflea sp. BRH_c9]|nr:MAG: 2-hydroxy-3-oxopropionate reductase [Hoeflea sp. BRH_c9]
MNSSIHAAIGFIGLGVMGSPMCRNLIRKAPNSRITVFDRSADATNRIADEGAESAANATELVGKADIVILSLPNGEAVESIISEVSANIKPGQVIIDTSTTPVALTKEMAARVRAAGADYLDAPIARTRQAAEDGTLSIMVGGDISAFERVRPILECMGSDVTHCGPVGAGQIVKILNNMVLFQTVHALSEALAIAVRAGIDGDMLFDVFSKGSADSFALRNHGRKALLKNDFPPRAFSTDYARKDNTYAIALAESVGVTARGANLLDGVFAQAQEQAMSDCYFPVFHKLHDSN